MADGATTMTNGFLLLLLIISSVQGVCDEGEVMLMNMNVSSGASTGLLLVCENEEFIGVCSGGFRNQESQAACRQLGFVSGVFLEELNPPGGIAISNTEYECRGHSIRLTNGSCTVSNQPCNADMIPRIQCSNRYITRLRRDYDGVIQESFNAPIEARTLKVPFNRSVPIGSRTYTSGVVHNTGFMSFGDNDTEIFVDDVVAGETTASIIYPFVREYEVVDMAARVQILENDPTSPNLELITRFINENVFGNFTTQLMILINWTFDNVYTVQSIIVTDFVSTHVVYIYECQNSYSRTALVGVYVDSNIQYIFRYSDVGFTSQLACSNTDSGINFYNLYHTLTEAPGPTVSPMPVNAIGSCTVNAFDASSCCRPFEDPTSSCAVGSGSGRCYCDALCFRNGDCCSDISTVGVLLQLESCVPLCVKDTVNQIDNTVFPIGPVGVCDKGYLRFIGDEGPEIQIAVNENVTCVQILSETNNLTTDLQISNTPISLDLYPVYRENPTCTGLENRIQDCPFLVDIETAIDGFLNVNCQVTQSSTCVSGNVRLVQNDLIQGDQETQGIAEICILDQWRSVCILESTINETLALALCGILNHPVTEPSFIFINDVTPDVGVAVLNCNSSVGSVQECTQLSLGSCSNRELLALSCADDEPILLASDETVTISALALGGIIAGSAILTLVVFCGVVLCFVAVIMIKMKRRLSKLNLVKTLNDEDESIAMKEKGSKRYVSQLPLNSNKATGFTTSGKMMKDFSDGFIIPSDKIRLLDCVGQGEFGLVYKAHYFQGANVDYVAVKTLKGIFDDNDMEDMIKESTVMKKLNHPNVMQLLGVCVDAGSAPYIVLPFMPGVHEKTVRTVLWAPGGSLLSYLKKNRPNLLHPGEPSSDDEEIEIKLLSMCLQIARGMEYIANQNLVHRDLASRNCMIDHEGNIKVSDFGLSTGLYEKMYFRQEKSDSVKLPIKWMALESIEDGIFSEKSDVWSFGVTCWEVFSGGKTPFGGIVPFSIPKLLLEGHRLERPYNAACSNKTYLAIMTACWVESPDDRPTFSSLVTAIDELLTSMAGYLDFNAFNLAVTTEYSDTKTPNDTEDEEED